MRILALVVDAFGGTGGIAQFNRDLISAWAELSNVETIDVLPRFAVRPFAAPASRITQHSPAPGPWEYACRALGHAWRTRSYDVVFCGHLHMMPLALMIGRLVDAPVWLQIHGLEAWSARSRTVRWCTEKADLVTSVSRHTRRLFLSWADVDAHRVLVLPNTVGGHFGTGLNRASAKERFGLSGRRVLLSVSRLAKTERYKGHESVIKLLPRLVRQFDNIAYVIAGDGDLREGLERHVRHMRLERHVLFTGSIDQDELPALYRAADVYVMPSRGEGFGIVYLEALASGIPVIAGDSDGARDPLHDGRMGSLVDEEQLLEAIRRTLTAESENSEAKEGNSRCAANDVRRHFGWPVFKERVEMATARFDGSAPGDSVATL